MAEGRETVERTKSMDDAEIAECVKEADIAECTKDAELAEDTKEEEIAECTKDAEIAEGTQDEEKAECTKGAELAKSTKEAETKDQKLFLCSPCESAGESHQASRYCIDCDELLCMTCVEFHMKFKSTKNHKLVQCNKDNFQDARLLSSYLLCPNHNDRAVEVKCEVHNTLCCLTCATVTHRNCQSTSEIRHLALGCKTDGQTDKLLARIEGINSCIQEIITINDEYLKDFESSKEEVPKALAKIKDDLMKLYDRIETSVMKKVQGIELDEAQAIENRRKSWKLKLNANKDVLKMLYSMLEVGTDSQIYVTSHKIKEILEETEKALAVQGGHILGQRLNVRMTKKMDNVLETYDVERLVVVEPVQNQYQLPKTSVYSEIDSKEEMKSTSDSLEETGVASDIKVGEDTQCTRKQKSNKWRYRRHYNPNW